MEKEPHEPREEADIVSEILNKGTKVRSDLLQEEFEKHLVDSYRVQETLDARKKLEQSILRHFELHEDLATNPEAKAEIEKIDSDIVELQNFLQDEKTTDAEIEAYLVKMKKLLERMERLQSFRFPKKEDVAKN